MIEPNTVVACTSGMRLHAMDVWVRAPAVLTDGDARFDLSVGGKGWWDYVAERLAGIDSRAAGSAAFARFNPQPGQILWEVRESMAAKVVVDRLGRGPLRYAGMEIAIADIGVFFA